MSDYKINLLVKERKNNFWRKVDEITGLDPKEASTIIDVKYSNNKEVKKKRLFDLLGSSFDEVAEQIDLLLSKNKK